MAADVGPGGGVGVLLADFQTQPQACSPLMTLLHILCIIISPPHHYNFILYEKSLTAVFCSNYVAVLVPCQKSVITKNGLGTRLS